MFKRYYSLGIFFLLLLGITVIYFPALTQPFIMDDYVWIEPLTLAKVVHLFVGSWEHGNTLRPVMRLQFFMDRFLFGERSLLWHFTNVLFHTIISWCLYKLVYINTSNRRAALFGAILFAVYPTNHEVVA
jgi:hypothetical protein